MKRKNQRVIYRKAPQWAWDIIDETLEFDAHSAAFDKTLRLAILDALNSMETAEWKGKA